MSVGRTKRILRLTHSIAAMPIPATVLADDCERFRTTGELPVHRRLAQAVVDRVLLDGHRSQNEPTNYAENVRLLARLIEQIEAGEPLDAKPPQLGDLLREALHDDELVRQFARAALQLLAGRGADLTAPGLFEQLQVPDEGTIGLHLVVLHADRQLPLPPAAVELFSTLEALSKTTIKATDVFPALRLAAEAGHRSAATVLNARWRDQTPEVDTGRPVGPPVPEGRELLRCMKSFVDFVKPLIQ